MSYGKKRGYRSPGLAARYSQDYSFKNPSIYDSVSRSGYLKAEKPTVTCPPELTLRKFRV